MDLFPDEIREQVYRIQRECGEDPEQVRRVENIVKGLVMSLVTFHGTVLSTKKFRRRRAKCEEVLRELDPDFADGYLRSKKVLTFGNKT